MGKTIEKTGMKKGGYNEFPPGWKEITEEEFAKSEFFQENSTDIECRQMYKEEGFRGKFIDARLFWYGNHGYSIVTDYWKGTVKFYHFGCEHKWERTRNLGNCYNEYTCKVCGEVQNIDSSD